MTYQQQPDVSAAVIAGRMSAGETFKAAKQENQIWDRCTPDSITVAEINVGNGFEDAVFVTTQGGTMVYRGPYQIENEPSADQLLLFFCEDYFFIRLPSIIATVEISGGIASRAEDSDCGIIVRDYDIDGNDNDLTTGPDGQKYHEYIA